MSGSRLVLIVVVLAVLASTAAAHAKKAEYDMSKSVLAVEIRRVDEKYTEALRSLLDGPLSERYQVLYSDFPADVRRVQIFPNRTTLNDDGTYDYSMKLFFFLGDEESGSVLVLGESMEEIAQETVEQIFHEFPMLALIREVSPGTVYVDKAEGLGFKKGVYCDVYDGNGNHVGVIKIQNADSRPSTAKIIRGSGEIEPGYTVASRHFVSTMGVGVQAFVVQGETKTGSVYTEETGLVAESLDTFFGARLAAIQKISMSGSEWGIGAGAVTSSGLTMFTTDLYFSGAVTILFDQLSAIGNVAIGLYIIPGQPYARPAGNYADGLPNEGKTTWNAAGYLRLEGGLRYFLKEDMSLAVSGGYLASGTEGDWEVKKNDDETVGIDPEWVKYSQVRLLGPVVHVTLSIGLFH